MLKRLLPVLMLMVGIAMADDLIVTPDRTFRGRIVGFDSTFVWVKVNDTLLISLRRTVSLLVKVDGKARADSLVRLESGWMPPYMDIVLQHPDSLTVAKEDSLAAARKARHDSSQTHNDWLLRLGSTPPGPTTQAAPNSDMLAGAELNSAGTTALWGIGIAVVGGAVAWITAAAGGGTVPVLVISCCTGVAALVCEIAAWVKVRNAGNDLQ